jgi:hypothetical protein
MANIPNVQAADLTVMPKVPLPPLRPDDDHLSRPAGRPPPAASRTPPMHQLVSIIKVEIRSTFIFVAYIYYCRSQANYSEYIYAPKINHALFAWLEKS